MLKNGRLSTRVGLGFFCILSIACVLGIFAAYQMSIVKEAAVAMALEHVPAVKAANEIERSAFLTVDAAREYVFGGVESQRAVAEENLAAVVSHLREASRIAEEQGNSELRASLERATERATDYERHLRDTSADIDAMNEIKALFIEVADEYERACNAFLSSQLQQLDGEITTVTGFIDSESSGAPSSVDASSIAIEIEVLRGRSRKAELGNKLVEIGNQVRSETWESIAMNEPERMAAAQALFTGVNAHLDELKALCRDESDLNRLEECRVAGATFSESMTRFMEHWRARETRDEERQVAAQAVLETARAAALLSIEEIGATATTTSAQLSRSVARLFAGLTAGAVVALLLAMLITSGIARPLEEITRVARLASLGETGHVPACEVGGEVGELAAVFKRMSVFLDDVSAKGRLIAEGDFSVEIAPRSDKDSLGMALAEMTVRLRAVAAVAAKVAAGDFSTAIGITHERDQLGRAINEMIERLRHVAEETRSRDWAKTGVAELADVMRGEHTVASLAEAVVIFLSNYVNAPMASVYIVDDLTSELVLQASCARDALRLPERIRLGEGVAGQAALERHIRQVQELPEGYARVTSSIGECAPRSVIAVPLVRDGRVIRVMEFAFSAEPGEGVLGLLRSVSEGIAVAFTASKSRERMQALLEELQAQAEELQTQTEELQSQTEELESQQQELQSSNEELEQQSEELRAANEELEEKTRALEQQAVQLDERRHEVERGKADIEEKARELELANRYKSEFLANMSHELRTPLNSLLILARMLASNDEGNLSSEQVTSARIIYEGGQDLLLLINEILDLSKVEAGMMDVHREEVSVDDLLARVQALFQATAADKGLEFSVSRLPGVPDTFPSDGQRLEQILRNLLANAVKFTAEGSVRLEVHRPSGELRIEGLPLTAENTLAFSVRDQGPGIPEDKHQAIFEAFQQADGSTSRRYGGTGLGLSISRALAHLLGGVLRLESVVGSGSTFTLYVPLTADAVPATTRDEVVEIAPPKVPHAMRVESAAEVVFAEPPYISDDRDGLLPGDRSVLIIEDDRQFAEILLGQVRSKGFKGIAARSGRAGVRLAGEMKPSAIILDLGLPDVDGGTVLDELKYNLGTRHIPVHIVSARDKAQEMLSKGALGYFVKPVELKAIDEALEKIESILQGVAKRILVIEDDENSRLAIERLLASDGVEIVGVATGQEAIAMVESGSFDCIILDLGLPDMTGRDLLDRIAANPAITIPPTIVYTGKELTRDEVQMLGKYTTNVVVKGANSPERLLDETSLFLHTVAASLPKTQRQMLRMLHDPEHLLRGRNVLIVDDDLRNSFALSRVLEKAELNVFMAENGQAALDLLDREEGIELVLMDIMMPVMDGYEAIGRIRAQARFKELPILALTAKAMREDRIRCIQAGANDYLAKPIDTDKLLSLMRILLYK